MSDVLKEGFLNIYQVAFALELVTAELKFYKPETDQLRRWEDSVTASILVLEAVYLSLKSYPSRVTGSIKRQIKRNPLKPEARCLEHQSTRDTRDRHIITESMHSVQHFLNIFKKIRIYNKV